MNACFKTIVVAVDFRMHTDAAIRKALELSSSGTVIHLIYVQNQFSVLPVFPTAILLEAMGFLKKQAVAARTKLRSLRKQILEEKPNVQVRLLVMRSGIIKSVLLNKARNENADLIIIGKSHCVGWLAFLDPPLSAQLAKEAPCAVLTVTAGAPEHAIETIVMPVDNTITYNTMGVITALSKKHRLHIHLVAFLDERDRFESMPTVLLRVYQWLKTSLQCQVQYKALALHHKMHALLQYADVVQADVILVDPELQAKAGWWRKHSRELLQPESHISILAVQPAGSFAIK